MGPDPSIGTARIYLTSQIRAIVGATNAMSYSNPEVDRLFPEGAAQPTKEAAGEIYKRIQKIIVQDMPCLWVMDIPYIVAFSPKIEGLPDSPWNGTGKLENVGWKK